VKVIRALIVQSFPDIREALREMMVKEKDLVLIGECTNGKSAVAAIRKHCPQLLFLGVRLRGMNGFEVLKSLGGDVPPAIIFVSPFDRYAVGAFGVHAVDYLLKPFTAQRFKQAIQRARVRLEQGRDRREAKRALPAHRFQKPISVKDGRRIVLLRPEEIDAVVAHRNYLALHAEGGVHRARSSLSTLQMKLPAGKFLRISRSTLVNARRIKEIVRKGHGDGLIRLESGHEFRLSRRYRAHWSALVDTKANVLPLRGERAGVREFPRKLIGGEKT
jgi:two-component system LytT family response regulator